MIAHEDNVQLRCMDVEYFLKNENSIIENSLSNFNEWITQGGSHTIIVRQKIYNN